LLPITILPTARPNRVRTAMAVRRRTHGRRRLCDDRMEELYYQLLI